MKPLTKVVAWLWILVGVGGATSDVWTRLAYWSPESRDDVLGEVVGYALWFFIVLSSVALLHRRAWGGWALLACAGLYFVLGGLSGPAPWTHARAMDAEMWFEWAWKLLSLLASVLTPIALLTDRPRRWRQGNPTPPETTGGTEVPPLH
jgi:hypothetical protein